MIKVQRLGEATRIVAVERDATILLARRFETANGPVFAQSQTIAFYEGRDGLIRSAWYAIGEGPARMRRFHGSAEELKTAFKEAGIPYAAIYTRQEMQALRAEAARKAASERLRAA